VAASVVGVQGLVLLLLAGLELADLSAERQAMGLSTAGFFAAYGAVLLVAGWALWRRAGWARGPVLITQLICLGLAWNVRDHVAVAVALAVTAVIALGGMLHPDSVGALGGHDDG
jgi:hypothetical protein